ALGQSGRVLGEDVVTSYVEGACAIVAPDSARELAVAYTPLHGVGAEVFVQAMAVAGFAPPIVVAEQARPDARFPTVAYPNPEEPGAVDLVIAVAAAHGAELAIAHDPDADRCAVALPARTTDGGAHGWQLLRGDEVGVLL